MPRPKPRVTTEPAPQPLSLEEALRRHQEGDRSPEVILILNQAAWEAYHAPWEASMEFPPMTDETPASPAPSGAPVPLTLELINTWVEQEGYSAFTHPTRGILITFKFSLYSDRCVQFRLSVAGRNADILSLVWTCDKRLTPEQLIQGYRLCNWWNNEYRWPRAMVDQAYRYTDANTDPPPSKDEVDGRELTHSSQLALDYQVALPQGVPPDILYAIIDATLETSWCFWRRAHEDWGL